MLGGMEEPQQGHRVKQPPGSYRGRRDYQVTFVHSHAQYLIVDCPECLAPVGLDCMSAHLYKNQESTSRYPVRPHKIRRLSARSLRLERFA
jgi:hypothetical protein